MKKGQTVFYTTGSMVIRARVERVHRDGSAVVTALFEQVNGKDAAGCYLGFKYRMQQGDLRTTA